MEMVYRWWLPLLRPPAVPTKQSGQVSRSIEGDGALVEIEVRNPFGKAAGLHFGVG